MMKISVGNQMIAKEGSARERFMLAKEAGLEGVEIWLGTGDANMESSDDDIRRLADAVGEAGLVCSSVASTLGWQNPITSLADDVFEQSLAIGRRQVEVAEMLGGGAILVVTGRVLPEAPYRQAWNRLVSGFRALSEFAVDRGVRVGAETCPKLSKNLMTPGECLMFVDAVDHPAVGIYLDTANVTYSGYAQDFVRDLGDRIVCIHAKDFTAPDEKGVYHGTWPGNGTVGWEAISDACTETGYDDWAVLEFSPVPGEEKGLELLRTARDSTNAIFNG